MYKIHWTTTFADGPYKKSITLRTWDGVLTQVKILKMSSINTNIKVEKV